MIAPTTVTIPGVILSDGTLEFAQPHGLPPGPVRVSLEQVGDANNGRTLADFPTAPPRLPDPPIFDTAISAPCDLPRPGPFEIVTPVELDEYPLPKPHDIDESME